MGVAQGSLGTWAPMMPASEVLGEALGPAVLGCVELGGDGVAWSWEAADLSSFLAGVVQA